MAESEGWDFFEPQGDAQDQPKDEIDVLMVRTFSSDEGQRVLKWLRQVTIEAPAWVPGQDPSFGFAREGQNSLVRELERRMMRGRL